MKKVTRAHSIVEKKKNNIGNNKNHHDRISRYLEF